MMPATWVSFVQYHQNLTHWTQLMESPEDRLAREAEWLEEALGEFRLAYGLDFDHVPERWQKYPESWAVAVALDRLSDEIAAYVGAGFVGAPPNFVVRWRSLSDRDLVDKSTLTLRDVREAIWAAMAAVDPSALGLDASGLEDPDTGESEDLVLNSEEGPIYELPAGTFLNELLRLKLGVAARDWSLERLLRVVELELTTSTETGQAFLHQAITRYVSNAGDKMVAVPCRAVLEAELSNRFSEAEVLRAGNARDPRHVKLSDYITHAWRASCFADRRVRDAALAVKEAGDKAVHDAPNLHDGGDILANLSGILKALRDD